ncbi:DnaT-like ssDNA-binding domain-containing protein [Alteromonas flava]|uniref:DnaT-like ssDNA-binding domain-containing protein n=1 Tax=Alteromonas flava TaxID=2048003 RepID=UPI000C28AA73|nr:DnaT-like ssDNA-binding domain-containing protein [Alteromonas flava]
MNDAERDALLQPISNLARVLYILGLRPTANTSTGATSPLMYKTLMQLLNSTEETITRGRQINSLVKELIQFGLVALNDEQDVERSLNQQRVVLPLVPMDESDIQRLHHQRQSMTPDWQPNKTVFEQLSQLVGLIDKHCTDEEIGDYVAYWLGRPTTTLSEFQWTQKFVNFLKQKRQARYTGNHKQIGSQVVQSKAGLEVDDNARKLVAKYATKQ